MKYWKTIFLVLVILFFSTTTFAQDSDNSEEKYPCSQNSEEKSDVIEKAELEPSRVGRILFSGNTIIRDRELRKTLSFQEGDIFTWKELEKSIRNLNALKNIYPVELKDVKIILLEDNRMILVTFCVKEKPKK